MTSYQIATVERRKARLPRTGRRGAFAKVPQVTRAVPALRLPQGRQRKDRAKARKEDKTG